MAEQQVVERRSQLATVLIPFRSAYVHGKRVRKGGSLERLLAGLLELAQGDDAVAYHAMVNLADYYRVAGNVDEALRMLAIASEGSAPQPVVYAAHMMTGIIHMRDNLEGASHAFR